MSVILGIKNRTENWKTAKHFARYFTNDEAVAKLAQRLGEPETTSGKCMQIELFWKGMRDHVKREQCKTGEWKSDELVEELEKLYSKHFNCLRADVEKFSALQLPDKKNYRPSEDAKGFFDNLRNTEIDIVIETPTNLFVGEAKGEMSFAANGSLVLVHQLVRQYVMAKILVCVLEKKKQIKIVPFVVANDRKPERTKQVQFMMEKGWLKRGNILHWDEIVCPHLWKR